MAADGPTGAKLASKIGGGFVFSGRFDGRLVRDPISMGIRNSEQKAWVVPAVSLATTRDKVIAESFALTARASRALNFNEPYPVPDISVSEIACDFS